MKEEPNFYAIIPANVRYNENLCPNAKLLYGEITALCNNKGYCWANNMYFSELYKVTKQTISGWISELQKEKLISMKISKKEGNKRIIAIKEKINTYIKKPEEVCEKRIIAIKEKPKHNNTYNNTSNNTYNIDTKVSTGIPEKKEYGNEDLNLIMQKAEELNFAIQGTKTYNRRMAWNLYKKFGLEKTIKSIEYAAAIRGQPYAPVINDFGQLYKKIGDLICFYEKEDKNKFSNKIGIIS